MKENVGSIQIRLAREFLEISKAIISFKIPSVFLVFSEKVTACLHWGEVGTLKSICGPLIARFFNVMKMRYKGFFFLNWIELIFGLKLNTVQNFIKKKCINWRSFSSKKLLKLSWQH